MAVETSSVAAEAPVIPVATETPVVSAVRERSLDLMEANLPPEQAQVLKASRKAKAQAAAKPAAPAAPTASEPAVPQAEAKPTPPPAKAEEETIDFGAEPQETPPAEVAEETPEALTEDEIAKLSEKARKQYLDAHKEATKVRKRAQEAEAKMAEKDTALTETTQKLTDLEKQLQEVLSRGPGLAGNEFGAFRDGDAVAAYGTNAQEAVALLTAHERAVKAGRADAEEGIFHTLPDGKEIEIKLESKSAFEKRVADAQAWFDADHKVGLNREAAKVITDKHGAMKGFEQAHRAYLTDTALHTRIPELAAKAALYDTLMARKARITFPDTASAASKAETTSAVTQTKAATKTPQAPPSESSASTPRMASSMSGDDLSARRSQLLELAKTAKNYDEQQKYLKQASMIPSGARTFAERGRRESAVA